MKMGGFCRITRITIAEEWLLSSLSEKIKIKINHENQTAEDKQLYH